MLREVKLFFKIKGSQLLSVSEHTIRAKVNTADALYETGAVKFNQKDVRYVRLMKVKERVLEVLKGHAENGHLRQYSAISGDKLRVTVSGDKGGSSTKLLLSFWDVEKGLSPHNSIPLALYKEEEDYELMKAVFGPVLEQLANFGPIEAHPSKPLRPLVPGQPLPSDAPKGTTSPALPAPARAPSPELS
jgi:Protein of unknown function (DUF1280)